MLLWSLTISIILIQITQLTAFVEEFTVLLIQVQSRNFILFKKEDAEKKNTGKSVILEDLRQMCVLKKYSKDTWEKYMSNYDSFCITDMDMDACGNTMLALISIDPEVIDQCVKKSFDIPDYNKCTKNTYLDQEQQLAAEEGVYMFPSLSINGAFYRV